MQQRSSSFSTSIVSPNNGAINSQMNNTNNTINNGSNDSSSQQDLRSQAFQQQLIAAMQQQQQTQQLVAGTSGIPQQQQQPQQTGLISSLGLSSPASLNLYQQLLNQQLQQQQNSTQQQQSVAGTAVAGLPQHFNSLHLQNSLSNSNFALPSVTPNSASSSVGPVSSSGPQIVPLTSGNGIPVALNQILASNPQLLQATLGQNIPTPIATPQNPTVLPNSLSQNPLISALAAQLLLPQNHSIHQQQQQQQQQHQQQQMLNLLQLIQNPNLLTYHNFLQQQQQNGNNIQQNDTNQQQLHKNNLLPAPTAQNPLQNQLNLLNQLITNVNSSNNQTSGLQQGYQTNVFNQLSNATGNNTSDSSNQTEENKAILEQLLLRQARDLQQQQQQQSSPLGNLQQTNVVNVLNRLQQQVAGTENPTQNCRNSPATSSNNNEIISMNFANREQRNLDESGCSIASTSQQSSSAFIPTAQAGYLSNSTEAAAAVAAVQHAFATNSRQTSSDRLLTSAESVEDHISRLISENEAIVEPNPVLLKRRPYHRQSTSNSITSQTSECNLGGSSQRASPGFEGRSPGIPIHKNLATRSQSMHENAFLNAIRMGGSLTSGQPIIRHYVNPNNVVCNYCQLKFPNEAGLEAHEFRCSKKEILMKQNPQPHFKQLPSQNLQTSQENLQQQSQQLLALVQHSSQQQQQQHQILQLQQQQKLVQQQQHQSNIAALVGGGQGVAPDVIINGAGNCGRSSVPIGSSNFSESGATNSSNTGNSLVSRQIHLLHESSASPTSAATFAAQQLQQQLKVNSDSPTPSTSSENRHPLKKRLLDAVARETLNSPSGSTLSGINGNANASLNLVDIMNVDAPDCASKIAKIDPSVNLQLLQQVLLQQRLQQQKNNEKTAHFDATTIKIEDLQNAAQQQQTDDLTTTNNFSLLQQVAAAAVQQQQQHHQQQAQQQLLFAAAAQQQQQQEMIAKVAEVAAAQQKQTQQNQMTESTSAVAEKLVQQIVANQAQLQQPEQPNNTSTIDSNNKLETTRLTTTTSEEIQQKRLPTSVECPKSMRDAIFLGVTYAEAKIGQKMPYLLSLDDQLSTNNESGEQSDVDSVLMAINTPYRSRLRQITSDTYLCLNRLKPTINFHVENLSMYNHCWQPIVIDADEEHMIRHYFKTFSIRPRMGVKEYCMYTTASKESCNLRTTHSSFWLLINKTNTTTNNGIVLEQQQQQNIPSQQSINEGECATANYEFHNEEKSVKEALINQQEKIQQQQQHLQLLIESNKERQLQQQKQDFKNIKDEQKQRDEWSNLASTSKETPIVKIETKKFSNFALPHQNKAKVARLPPTSLSASIFSNPKINPIGRTDEVDVYVRGRGRGRYVCERCGIRCKKPSMLKKHLRSHTDQRDFACITCNFSFKTKGNLTKHLFSKAHRRRLADNKGIAIENEQSKNIPFTSANSALTTIANNQNDLEQQQNIVRSLSNDSGEGRLIVDTGEESGDEQIHEIKTSKLPKFIVVPNSFPKFDCDDPTIMKFSMMESKFVNDEYDEMKNEDDETSTDNEDEEPSIHYQDVSVSYKRFGQENILCERSTHTPPTLWTLFQNNELTHWPRPIIERSCHSAPPVGLCSPPDRERRNARKLYATIHKSSAIAQTPSLYSVFEQNSEGNFPLGSGSKTGGGLSESLARHFLLPEDNIDSDVAMEENSTQMLANFIPIIAKSSASLNHPTSTNSAVAAAALRALNVTSSHNSRIQNNENNLNDLSFENNNNSFLQTHQFQQQQQQNKLLSEQFFGNPAALVAAANKNNTSTAHNESRNFSNQTGHLSQQQSNVAQSTSNYNKPATTTNTNLNANSMEAFLAKESQEFQCTMCERKFRKESELVLHKQTHLIERQQNAKSRSYLCAECHMTLKSKNLLNKHMDQVHNNQATTNKNTSNTPNGGDFQTSNNTSSDTTPQPLGSHNALRTFRCHDCDCAFRTHGVLSKHLRSKNHVRNLVNMGKLPEDANELVRDHTHILANIDSTDCEAAKTSLSYQLCKLRSDLNNSFNSINNEVIATNATLVNSLECREQLTALSPVLANNFLNDDNSDKMSNRLQNAPKKQAIATVEITPSVNTSSSIISGYKKSHSALPHGLKRKNNESDSTDLDYSIARKRCDSSINGNRVYQQQQHQQKSNGQNNEYQKQNASQPNEFNKPHYNERLFSHTLNPINTNMDNGAAASPLHSLANLAAEHANWYSLNANNNNSTSLNSVTNKNGAQITNVWIPPRIEQIEADRKIVTNENKSPALFDSPIISYNMMSNRSAEDTSESTGRSESSTPVQKMEKIGNFSTTPSETTNLRSTPSISTRCQMCEISFETPAELQVHFQVDHVVMRDGQDFRCPQKHCNKIFPNRFSLRKHISVHFFANNGINTMEERDEMASRLLDSPLTHHRPNSRQQQNVAINGMLSQHGSVHAATAASAPNKSPDAPEETDTTTHLRNIVEGGLRIGESLENRGNSQQQIASSTTAAVQNGHSLAIGQNSQALRCNLCGDMLPNTDELQRHWITHISNINNTRPFVCQQCDAGFTTAEALNSHSATHL